MARKSGVVGVTDGYYVVLPCDRACYGAEMRRRNTAWRPGTRLQCDRACYGAEIRRAPNSAATRISFNVTAPVMARK